MTNRSTALHEAAHFVASYALGRHEGVYLLSVEIMNGTLGRVAAEAPDFDSADEMEDEIVSLYAGFAAMVHDDPESEEYARSGSESDDETAAQHIHNLGLPLAETEAKLRHRASSLVAENWGLIEALAADLLVEITIDVFEATMVVEVAAGVSEAADSLREYRKLKHPASAEELTDTPVFKWQKEEGGADAPPPSPAG